MSTEAPDGLDCLGCGNEFSASLSLTISGGKACDDGCKAKGKYCYAQALEKQYPALYRKMKRRQADPVRALNRGTLAIRRLRNYFIRLGKLGTLLPPAEARKHGGYLTALRLFVLENVKADNEFQLFVESPAKAKFYRSLFKQWGAPYVVRESLQSLASVQRRKAGQQTSYIVGEDLTGYAPRIAEAHRLADTERAKGKTVVVCGKVRASKDPRPKRKCGDCTACCSPVVDLILFPKHK